jgi:hypothetical protein
MARGTRHSCFVGARLRVVDGAHAKAKSWRWLTGHGDDQDSHVQLRREMGDDKCGPPIDDGELRDVEWAAAGPKVGLGCRAAAC